MRREKHEPGWRQRGIGFDRSSQCEAIHSGHVHINDCEVARVVLGGHDTQLRQRFGSILRQEASDPPVLGIEVQNAAVGGMVIHHAQM